jgi:hypothetical protein
MRFGCEKALFYRSFATSTQQSTGVENLWENVREDAGLRPFRHERRVVDNRV